MTNETQSIDNRSNVFQNIKSFFLHYFNQQWLRKGRAGLLAIGIGIVGSGVVIATAPQYTPKVIEEKVWPIVVMDVLAQTLSAQLRLYGRVSTPSRAELASAVSANVTNVLVSEGQRVQKGDLLIQLDDSDTRLALEDLEAGLLDAKANLTIIETQYQADLSMLSHQKALTELANAKFERYQQLNEQNLVSAASLEEYKSEARQQAIALEQQQVKTENFPNHMAAAKAKVNRAKARLAQAQLNLERTRVYAPFSGAVTHLLVAAGERVDVGRGLLRLYDASKIQVRAAISSFRLPRLQSALANNNEVVAHTTIHNQNYHLKLVSLNTEVSASRGGVDGIFEFQQMPAGVLLGQLMNLTVTLPAQTNLMAIPAHAVYEGDRVYVVKDGRLLAVNVHIAGQIEDSEGQYRMLIDVNQLTAGEKIMVSQLANANTGLKVSFNE